MKENEILENVKVREGLIDQVEVLEKVKDLLLLGDSNFATVQQVADYYEVGIEAIQSLVKDNREELESNGMRLYKRAEILTVLEGQLGITVPNRGMKLFPKRAILNVGMLLRDSNVAKEVRSRLLDIEYESNHAIQDNGQTVKENITDEIDKEKELTLRMGTCLANGDFNGYLEAQCELTKMKNERIKILEGEIEVITTHSLTLTESRDVINKLVRKIAMVEYNGLFGKAFGELYKIVNYQLGINIKGREKKKSESYLHTLTEEEIFKVEEIVRTWANKLGIDVEEELKLA